MTETELCKDNYTKETYVYSKFFEEINVDGSISTVHRWEYNV